MFGNVNSKVNKYVESFNKFLNKDNFNWTKNKVDNWNKNNVNSNQTYKKLNKTELSNINKIVMVIEKKMFSMLIILIVVLTICGIYIIKSKPIKNTYIEKIHKYQK